MEFNPYLYYPFYPQGFCNPLPMPQLIPSFTFTERKEFREIKQFQTEPTQREASSLETATNKDRASQQKETILVESRLIQKDKSIKTLPKKIGFSKKK